MKNSRRVITILSTIAVLVVSFFGFCAMNKSRVSKTLLATPLYKNSSYDSNKLVAEIAQNENVTVIKTGIKGDDGNNWAKISYYSFVGFIPESYLYECVGEDEYSFIIGKATGKSTSEQIKIFRYFDENAEVVAEIGDGEKVNLIVNDSGDYGEYVKVLYNGEYCFMKKENVTSGLTYNQKIAIIISCALIGGGIAVGVIAAMISKKKRAGGKNK